MALKFKIHQVDVRDKDGVKRPRQVALQQTAGRITINEVAEQLEIYTSLGRGDVLSVLTHLGEVIAMYMKLGYSVQLHELGTFTPRITSRAVPVGEDFTTDHIKGVNMRFTPHSFIKNSLKETSFKCVKEGTCKAPERDETTDSEGTTIEEGDGGFI